MAYQWSPKWAIKGTTNVEKYHISERRQVVSEHKSVLYLGFDAKHYKTEKPVIHMPLVEIDQRPIDSIEIKRIFSEILNYTHMIFASKNSVKIFFNYLEQYGYSRSVLTNVYIIAIGQITAFYLREAGITPTYIASDETQEGVIRTLSHLDLEYASILLPRSSSARPLLAHYLVEHGIRHQICTLYDMCKRRPYEVSDLNEIDEVIFTTPIAVDVFFEIYRQVPKQIKLHPIGPMARERLRTALHVHQDQTQGHCPAISPAFAC